MEHRSILKGKTNQSVSEQSVEISAKYAKRAKVKKNTKLVKYNKFQNNDIKLFIFVCFSNSIATFRQRLTQKVDIAWEQAPETIHKASSMSDIDESECLSCWTTVKKYTQATLEDVSKWMRAFFVKQHVKSDVEMLRRLEEVNKLAQELIDRKKELKAAMFVNVLLSFIPNGDASRGKLVFTTIKLPSKTRATTNTELESIDVSAAYDSAVPLESGRSIAKLRSCEQLNDSTAQLTEMSIELKIREHCDSLHKKSDILREITAEYIRNASSDQELFPSFDKALKELSNLYKDLKGAIFDNNLLSFIPSRGASFSPLVFTYYD